MFRFSHRFPLHDESLLHKWIKFTDRGVDWKPSRWSSICSRHFLNNDFREFLSRKCLKKNAIPSVVTKNNISYETYHIADQSSKANSQCEDEDLSDCNDSKENGSMTDAQQNEGDKLRLICCRLCGDRIVESVKTGFNFRIDDQEIGEMIRKCLPSISISRHITDHLNLICHDCVSQLRAHSEFVDKVLIFQRDFGRVNNTDTSLEQMIFESRTNNNSSTSNSALFIKQEPINVKQEIFDSSNKKPLEAINVMKPSIVPLTSMIAESAHDISDKRINVVEPTLIHWPRTYANTFCRLCERFFINKAEMQAHTCTGSQQPTADRCDAINSTSNNNNCEIMEIITLNNPVSFIDLAEDEYATVEQTAVCKKENVIDVPRERVDIEHAYAKRSTITTASNNCKLKQEIEISYDCDSNEEEFVLDTASNNDSTTVTLTPYLASSAQENFNCSECGQEFTTNRLLVEHSNKMHSLRNRICPICSAEFKSTYEFLLHKNKVHVSGGFRCQQCNRKFTTRIALRNHERHSCLIDSVDYYYSCRHCGKFMRNRFKMKEHLRICAVNPKGRVEELSSTNVNTTKKYSQIPSTESFNCFRCHRSFSKEINFVRKIIIILLFFIPSNLFSTIFATETPHG